jgi:vacuolar-type H+-ATPase subunit I/STV1
MLNKIMTLLSVKEEVALAYGQLKDGTILESNTFDVGETIDVVSEDGTKSPAPTGEHEIALKDSEGKEVVIRVLVADGKITERENVEEAAPMAPEESQVEIEREMEMEVMPEEPMDEKDMKIKDLEAKIMEMESMINEFKAKKEMEMAAVEVTVDEDEDEEVDVPVLDGAPVEEEVVNLSYKFNPAKQQSTMDRVLQNLSK